MNIRGLMFSFIAALVLPNLALAQDNFYNIGFNLGSTNVNSAWGNFTGDCAKADTLLRIVSDSSENVARQIRSGQYASASVERFADGYVNGLTYALSRVVKSCGDSCRDAGRVSGKASAAMFCAVSEVIGRTAKFNGLIDKPNMICGEAYRTSCESSFVSLAHGRCETYANGPEFSKYYRSNESGCCSYSVRGQ